MHALLDDYQVEGARWLAGRKQGLLADAMGIGKSAQAVAAADLANVRTIDVLCQGGKRLDWVNDFARWSNRHRPINIMAKRKDLPIFDGINLCSFDLAEQLVDYRDMTGNRADLLLIDEVQFLRSPAAKRTLNILGPGGLAHWADRHWLLSGTPFVNNPFEMWPWLYTLFPQAIDFMTAEKFMDHYCILKPSEYGSGVAVVGGKNLAELRQRLDKIMLRRGEEVVDLPPLTITEMPISSAEVASTWDKHTIAELNSKESQHYLLEILAKLDAGGDFEPDPKKGNFKTYAIATLRKALVTAKVRKVCEIVRDEIKRKEIGKVVIFGYHRDGLMLAAEYFKDFGLKSDTIWGGVDPAQRRLRLNRFVTSKEHNILMGQIDATGTGIDGLQAASCEAVFLESSWTPGNNVQAIKRLHRRGQKNPVRARFAVLDDSLDTVVHAVNLRKMKMFMGVFG